MLQGNFAKEKEPGSGEGMIPLSHVVVKVGIVGGWKCLESLVLSIAEPHSSASLVFVLVPESERGEGCLDSNPRVLL